MYRSWHGCDNGDSPWQSFSVMYSGAMPDDSPSWMTTEYDVWFRDPKVVLEHQLVNPNFKGEIDYATKVVVDEDGHHEVCDLMSSQWVFEQSISGFFLVAAQVTNFKPDPRTSSQRMLTHGAIFVPVVLGSDKPIVSVATGHTEYYPLYISLGNIHNNVCRVHRDAILILSFLAIPKSKCVLLF